MPRYSPWRTCCPLAAAINTKKTQDSKAQAWRKLTVDKGETSGILRGDSGRDR